MSSIILIGGGSASGKTFVSKKIIEELGSDNVTRISIDDYYKDLTNILIEKRAKINYDSPSAFDWPLLAEHISELKKGNSINKPIYDFTIHNRKEETELIFPRKIIIIEGIMALVKKEIRELGDAKVFIKASAETRLIRRLKRDHEERGRSYDSILKQYFSQVIPSYEDSIGPSSNYADMIMENNGETNKALNILLTYIKSMIN